MTRVGPDEKIVGMSMRVLRDRQLAEHELVLAAQGGNRDAREMLIEQLRPLVGMVARTYRGCRAVDREELMQEGAVGLLRALQRYDPHRGEPFWAYAVWYVRQSMQRLVAELGQPLVLSDRALRQLAQVKHARRRLTQSRCEEPSTMQLAAATGMTRDQIDRLVAVERTPRALDEPLRGDDERSVTVSELLADPSAEESFERVEALMEAERRQPRFDRLSDRQRRVLGARFGVNRPVQTLREIGKRMGISAERVRQIEHEALEQARPRAHHGRPKRNRR